ncbi:hypothetical protein C6N75_04450 [Streptomyces solincola]|uniref:BON domain-containing protein n=1 Tax=Streptomyces solincola TaxID=2100817 RepID=A0A2S9Q197_9ACTN|nr:BON domain-containing protein [Streptomyces solincola]PRH80383.1 hypothetical protein C6N75_04450 [Streptomyces solincola]
MDRTMDVKQEGSDAWITTKVKADLMTDKGIPGADITVETSQGVVSLSSDVAVTAPQKEPPSLRRVMRAAVVAQLQHLPSAEPCASTRPQHNGINGALVSN